MMPNPNVVGKRRTTMTGSGGSSPPPPPTSSFVVPGGMPRIYCNFFLLTLCLGFLTLAHTF
jgi:hypothetical protein